MRAESYLTFLDGLLATAVYHPRKPDTGPGMPGCWTVPVGEVGGAATWRSGCSVTRLPGTAGRTAAEPAVGMSSSATPVCGIRLSLHG